MHGITAVAQHRHTTAGAHPPAAPRLRVCSLTSGSGPRLGAETQHAACQCDTAPCDRRARSVLIALRRGPTRMRSLRLLSTRRLQKTINRHGKRIPSLSCAACDSSRPAGCKPVRARRPDSATPAVSPMSAPESSAAPPEPRRRPCSGASKTCAVPPSLKP